MNDSKTTVENMESVSESGTLIDHTKNNAKETRPKRKISYEDRSERENKLSEIISTQKTKGQDIKIRLAMAEMRKHYPDYNYDQYRYDLRQIARHNTFLRDMTEIKYSSIIEDMFNDIEKVRDEASLLLDKARTEEKKRASGRLMLECVDMKNKLLSGNIIDVSIQLLSNKLEKLEADNRKLEIERDELKLKNKELVQPNG